MARLAYYGDVISPNMARTPEGYLICKNVPIGRTGTMQYEGKDIGLEGEDAYKVFDVIRTEEDLFEEAAIASFEGKPTTNGHPVEDVLPVNWAGYSRGHVQNVRRGTGEDTDKMIADLYITDPVLISEIEQGKREVSSGYTCRYAMREDGIVHQMGIRGNHVAVVDKGRAGATVSIKDEKPEIKTRELERGKKRMFNKNKKTPIESVLNLFAKSARDAKTVEEVEEITADAAEAIAKMEEIKKTEDVRPVTEVKEKTVTEVKEDEKMSTMGEVLDAIAKLAEKVEAITVEKTAQDESMVEKIAKKIEKRDPIDRIIAELEDEVVYDENTMEKEEALTVPAETMDAEKAEAKTMDKEEIKSAALEILKNSRPAIAEIKNEEERTRVTDALIKAVRHQVGDQTGKILDNAYKTAQIKATDAALVGQSIDLESRQTAYDNRNPHTAKKGV